ncbi:hypothetical protein ASD60_23315 [Pseudomonas sp. Root562]|nr:hypothetical protein ASD60_23315 [Pseudomonas sp. Root562]
MTTTTTNLQSPFGQAQFSLFQTRIPFPVFMFMRVYQMDTKVLANGGSNSGVVRNLTTGMVVAIAFYG